MIRSFQLCCEVSTIDNLFTILNGINVNKYVEKKNGLSYLTWSYAWSEVKKIKPDAIYNIKKFGEKQLPYVYDEETGFMVFTDVTIDGITHEMWLPVMDGANKAMKAAPYTYQVKEYKGGKWTGGFTDKSVDAADMFDINKTIMRCLVKNLAMFGLGLYIYAGEDLPEEEADAGNKLKDLLAQIKTTIDEKKATGVTREMIAETVKSKTNGMANYNNITDVAIAQSVLTAIEALSITKTEKAEDKEVVSE